MKTYQSWLLGALACATIVPFTGCTKDEMVGPNGGNGETVKTEFSISLTTGKSAQTRATGDETQNTTNAFNGMNGINLVSYDCSDLTNFAPAGTENIISVISLKDISSTNTPTSGNTWIKEKNVIDLNQEKQAFLFYGKSAYSGVGDIVVNIPSNTTVTDINFNLKDKEEPNDADYETIMENYLANVYLALYNYNSQYLTGEGATGDVLSVYNALSNAKSGAFEQIAHLMAQIYDLASNNKLTAGTTTSGTLDNIKNAIFETGVNETLFTAITPSSDPSTELSYTTVTDGLATALDAYYLPTVYELKFHNLTVSGNAISDKADLLTLQTVNKYAHPAALYYYVNSYPVEYTDYDNLSWTGGLLTGNALDLSGGIPAKVAMAHTAQYAVGRLDVKLGTESSSATVADSKGEDVTFANLELNAILIGNQKQVGWNFLPNDDEEKVIYDYEFGTADGSTTPWQVLAFPTAAGKPVNIALEMVNNDKDFYGKGGQIIPKGSTFYLTAALNPTTASNSTGITNPAVFMSDYYTTANLTLKSLVNADNTVPDLSGSNFEFALSVDLSWTQGLVFDVTIP